MTQSVSKLISERYGLQAQTGKKGECPHCGHHTLSVHPNDGFAKCFHPSCGKVISSGYTGFSYNHSYQEILNDFYSEWRDYFLSLERQDHVEQNAYRYIVEERLIHPDVVKTDIGCIPPSYNEDTITRKFNPLIEEIEEIVNNGRIEEESDWNHQKFLALVRNARDKLVKLVNPLIDEKRPEKGRRTFSIGRLVFVYRDHYYRITAFKLRVPYTKDIVTWKPDYEIMGWRKKMGVFGLGLFTEAREKSLAEEKVLIPCVDSMAVMEGEFNVLQLQSLVVRNNRDFINAVAIGGVETADLLTLKKIVKVPTIIYDNDDDEAGFTLVENGQKLMTVRAFTTPEPYKDVDEYIKSFGDSYEEAFNAVGELSKARKYYPRNYDSVREEVEKIRYAKKYNQAQIFDMVAGIIQDDLVDRGRMLNNNQHAYFFFNHNKELIPISKEGFECERLLGRYGLMRSSPIFKHTLDHLRHHAFENGQKTETHRFAFYNPNSNVLYVYNNDHQIFKITTNGKELVDNGTDGVLFLHDPDNDKFELVQYEDSPLYSLLIERINFDDDILSVEERRYLILLWIPSLFFETKMPTKVILAMIGEKGSGKTFVFKVIGKTLFGSGFNVTDVANASPKDFDAVVTHRYFMALDNADTQNKWIEDRLAISATGCSQDRRELYTTNELVSATRKCFIGITARTPNFRRDDVAERLLIMKVKKIEDIISEEGLLTEIMEHRNEIMSEIIDLLQEAVQAMADKTREVLPFRMADFANFALKFARHVGNEDSIREIFSKLSAEQSQFALEEEEIFDLMKELASKQCDGRTISDVTNQEFCDRLAEVYDERHGTSRDGCSKWKYAKEYKKFGYKMRGIMSDLQRFFEVREEGVTHKQIRRTYVLKDVGSPE
jgi:transcription elongation factor Elf1